MKKFIFSLSALAALLLAGSCQRENLEPVEQGGTVTYTVQVPGALATKAAGDYELIYEVYRQAQVGTGADPIYEGKQTFSGNSVNLPLEFVKNQNFVVLFWAQKEGLTAYNTGNLRNVTLNSGLTANQENYEVFAGMDEVSNCVSSNNGNVELVRPIAQLNIATDAEGLKLGNTDVTLTSSFVTVKGLSTTYNVYNKAVSETLSDVEFSVAAVPAGKLGTTDYKYVAMNYIGFIDANGTTVNVDFTVKTSEGDIAHSVSSVPVMPNYKTNIIGNLITATDKYQVTLGAWGNEETNVEVVAVSTAQELQEAINEIQDGAEGNIILEGNIDLGTLFGASTLSVTKAGNVQLPIVIDKNKTMTLDLNGFTITTPWESETDGKHYYAFENHGTLNIVDSKVNGKIKARGIFNYGKMTLESGTIEACDGNGGYGVRNYKGAEFVMNGGTVATIYDDGDIPGEGYDASPIRVDQGAKAEIKGGIINNVSNFTVAIDNYGETIVDGGTFTSVHTTLANSAVMTINGGSFTCNGLEGITAHALWAAAGTTTINGGTFNGKDNYNGFNVDASKGATVYIKGGEFLPVHSGSLYGDGSIIVTGGTFFDKVSEKYLAVGYSCQQNEEKKWIIRECPVRIGEAAYYATLAEAVAAVQEGETITILAGKTLEEGTIKLPATLKNVTFAGEEGATLKDMTITAADGNSIDYDGVTFDGITFDNSNVVLTGWRTGKVSYKNITINGCTFKNVIRTNNEAAFHINCTPTEAVNGFNFTDNVIDGVSGASNSGVYAQLTGEIFVSGNVINNVAFRPYVIQVTTDDNVADNFVVTNNTFSGSAVGRAQGLGNNANGTDAVHVVVTKNIFKGITDAQQICYWNFNPAKTTADLSHNYYDIDILANPGKIYYNSAAANVYDLLDMGVFPIYTDAAKTSLYTPEVNSAKIGETEYSTLEEAVAAAKADDTITLLCNVTLSESLTLPAGIIFNGNGKQINGTINAGGNLTFAGHTKVTSFSASYYNRVITIGEGACLEVTGGGRVTLGYGNTFNITGNIENAKTADKANVQPSLIIPAGISITGGNNAAMNVTNAYVQIGSTTSKPGAANGEFTLNFTNSIVEFTNEFGFYAPTGGVNPQFKMSITNSVFTTGAKLCVAAVNSTITVNNSNVLLGTYLRNSGTLNIIEGSVLTGKTIQFGENGGNDGTINVDASTLEIVAGSTGHAFDGKENGSINATNCATVKVDYYKAMTINTDATSTFEGIEVK